MKHPLKTSALAIIAGVFASILAPPPPLTPSAWAAQHFVLPDGERKGEPIDLARTPHLIEPLDALGPDSPDNEVAVMKSGQSAFTTALQIIVAHSIDRDPCDMMVTQPTEGALTDFNSQKFGRAIELSRERGELTGERTWGVKVLPQLGRSGRASTAFEKKFGTSSVFLSLASSAAELRSKTIKKALCDEIDEYPRDLQGQGDPLDMVAARQITFLRSGTWKRGYFSTPRIKGLSKIERKFEAGDQRRWHVECPACRERFVFAWNAPYDDRVPGLKFNKQFPYEAHYIPPCCGVPIGAAQKYAVYRTGIWIATAERPGAFKSYHFDALSSPFVPWDDVAKQFVEAGDDQENLKTFWNLWLGLPFEEKGDAPDYVKLLERREDYPAGVVPAAGLLLVAGGDVQHGGIWYEVVAYGSDKQSWSIEHGFIEGDTTDPRLGAFAELAMLYDRQFPDAFGGMRLIEAFALDAGDGGRSNQVYAWTRVRHRAFAVKGVAGWTTPAIGTPGKVSISLKGRKLKGGAMSWPVGTYSLKGTYYDSLRKLGVRGGADVDPPGYCHFHEGCDERFFKQMTAEYVKTVTSGNRVRREWIETGPNHLLDCRTYAAAMADYLGMNRLTPDQWAALRLKYGVPAQLQQPDLLAPDSVKIAAAVHEPLLQKKRRVRRMLSRGIA